MVAMGLTRPQIAQILGISDRTLVKYYEEDLAYGDKVINAAIVNNLARQALKDDFRAMPAAMFWAKTRMGWRDVSTVEHSGPNGSGLVLNIISSLPPKEPEE